MQTKFLISTIVWPKISKSVNIQTPFSYSQMLTLGIYIYGHICLVSYHPQPPLPIQQHQSTLPFIYQQRWYSTLPRFPLLSQYSLWEHRPPLSVAMTQTTHLSTPVPASAAVLPWTTETSRPCASTCTKIAVAGTNAFREMTTSGAVTVWSITRKIRPASGWPGRPSTLPQSASATSTLQPSHHLTITQRITG